MWSPPHVAEAQPLSSPEPLADPTPAAGPSETASEPRGTGAEETLSADAERSDEEADWQLVGGLGTWAVGMGLVVVFNYAFFRLNDVVRDDAMKSYRAGVPEGDSSCDRARAGLPSADPSAASASDVASLCDEADTMEALRNITLPIGLGASLLGLVLIGTSDSVTGETRTTQEAGRWTFRVAGGPASASVYARVALP